MKKNFYNEQKDKEIEIYFNSFFKHELMLLEENYDDLFLNNCLINTSD